MKSYIQGRYILSVINQDNRSNLTYVITMITYHQYKTDACDIRCVFHVSKEADSLILFLLSSERSEFIKPKICL